MKSKKPNRQSDSAASESDTETTPLRPWHLWGAVGCFSDEVDMQIYYFRKDKSREEKLRALLWFVQRSIDDLNVHR